MLSFPVTKGAFRYLEFPLLEQLTRLLEDAFDILEQLDAIFDNLDHLFEQLTTILENEVFIRSF